MNEIQHFTDLLAWKKAHQLVLDIYQVTRHFPDIEKFALVVQTNKAAVSITGNIAEGFDRFFYRERIQFYYYARGSAGEVENYLITARDLGYINQQTFEHFQTRINEVSRLVNWMIKTTNERVKGN